MCKEQYRSNTCACGMAIEFTEYHWPHCPANPNNMTESAKKDLSFSRSQLATIALHGPMQDERLTRGKRGKKR